MISAFDIQQSLSGRKKRLLYHRKIVKLESNYLFQTNYWAVFIYLTILGSKLSSHSLKLVLYVVHVLKVTKQMTELKSRRYTNLTDCLQIVIPLTDITVHLRCCLFPFVVITIHMIYIEVWCIQIIQVVQNQV